MLLTWMNYIQLPAIMSESVSINFLHMDNCYESIRTAIVKHLLYQWNISSNLSRNAEMNSLDFLENIEEMFSWYCMHSNVSSKSFHQTIVCYMYRSNLFTLHKRSSNVESLNRYELELNHYNIMGYIHIFWS